MSEGGNTVKANRKYFHGVTEAEKCLFQHRLIILKGLPSQSTLQDCLHFRFPTAIQRHEKMGACVHLSVHACVGMALHVCFQSLFSLVSLMSHRPLVYCPAMIQWIKNSGGFWINAGMFESLTHT